MIFTKLEDAKYVPTLGPNDVYHVQDTASRMVWYKQFEHNSALTSRIKYLEAELDDLKQKILKLNSYIDKD